MLKKGASFGESNYKTSQDIVLSLIFGLSSNPSGITKSLTEMWGFLHSIPILYQLSIVKRLQHSIVRSCTLPVR